MSEFKYIGSELELFAAARHWKAYWSKQLRRFVSGDVLEVGAGIGANTRFLDTAGDRGQWVCLEPDPWLGAELIRNLRDAAAPDRYEVVCGTVGNLAAERNFDTIIYIDVLEHIEDDGDELRIAASHLRPGGAILVLSPAHQWLFTPFDAAIGHYRRYDRSLLLQRTPPVLKLELLRYLDCIGLLASVANRLLLRQSMPTKAQLHLWDNWMIPLSAVLDRFLCYSLGKTIIGVWRRPAV